MPIYYFHLREHGKLEEDPEGTIFATDEEAHHEAVLAAREMVAEAVLHGEAIDAKAFEVQRDDGPIIATIMFVSVIEF